MLLMCAQDKSISVQKGAINRNNEGFTLGSIPRYSLQDEIGKTSSVRLTCQGRAPEGYEAAWQGCAPQCAPQGAPRMAATTTRLLDEVKLAD